MKDKKYRLRLFFKLMNRTPAVSSITDAVDQVKTALKIVEDRHTNIIDDYSNYGKTDRLFVPATSIAWNEKPDYSRVDLAKYYMYFHSDGSLAYALKKDAVVIWAKTGANSFFAPKVGKEHPDKQTWKKIELDLNSPTYFGEIPSEAESNLALAWRLSQIRHTELSYNAEEIPLAKPWYSRLWASLMKKRG